MATGSTPNYIAKQPVFDSNAVLTNPSKLASILGTEYNTTRSTALWNPVICEVKFNGSQHFVVRYNGKIYDPLSSNGNPLRNYEIISYRNVKPKENMGKVVWNDIEVIFTDGQVREMSRDILQKERGATGNESWGFVQECGVYARNKYASDKKAIDNLVKGSIDKVKEIDKLKGEKEEITKLYNKAVTAKNEFFDELEIAKGELTRLSDQLEECKKKPSQDVARTLWEAIVSWWENRKK